MALLIVRHGPSLFATGVGRGSDMAMHISAIPHDGRSAPAESSLAGAYSLAILGWLLSAGVYIAARWATAEMPPWALTFWRLALAGAIILPIVRQHYPAMLKLIGARPIQLLLTAGLGFTLCQGLLYTG